MQAGACFSASLCSQQVIKYLRTTQTNLCFWHYLHSAQEIGSRDLSTKVRGKGSLDEQDYPKLTWGPPRAFLLFHVPSSFLCKLPALRHGSPCSHMVYVMHLAGAMDVAAKGYERPHAK